MDRYLKLSFDNVKGRNCEQCMLSFSKGEHNHCAALGNRPICSEEGCRKDCPLVENVIEGTIIEACDEGYREVMRYSNSLYADYTRNDYRDLFKTKSKKELLQIQADVDKKIKNVQILYEKLFQKGEICNEILDTMK